jgi:hypothetical protein
MVILPSRTSDIRPKSPGAKGFLRRAPDKALGVWTAEWAAARFKNRHVSPAANPLIGCETARALSRPQSGDTLW